MSRIDELDDNPRHTIGTVASQTGILPVTLRMWERRYGLLAPRRTPANYRLYSEREVALLRWLKSRVDTGQPIRSAIAALDEMRRAGDWPDALPSIATRQASAGEEAKVISRLYRALVSHNENQAGKVVAEASARFGLTSICQDILTPVLVEIGEAWHRGEIRIATEHFASTYLRGHLLSLYQSYPILRRRGRALVGCAPGERHEIGSLMLALFLRRGGARVEYLGPDVDLDDLISYLRTEPAEWVCLSAASELTALALERVERRMARLDRPPRFGFGGQAFNLVPALRERIGGTFLGETAAAGASAVLEPPASRLA